MTKCVLGDLMEVTRGASLAGKYYATAGDKIRLTLANFDYANNCFKPDTSKDNVFYTQAVDDRFVLIEGDIITPLTEQTPGLLGTTARIPESGKYIQSQDVALLKPFTEKLDPDYCFYLVSSKAVRNQLGAMSQQTKIRHSSPDKIKSCTVFLPELEKQRRIGAFLSAIDRNIALNRKRIATLEAMAKEIYDYWFVQFDFPDAHGRPYKSSGGEMVYNPDLKREIPKGWAIKTVGDIANVVTGKEDASFATDNGMYPFFTCSQKVLKCDEYKFDGKNVLVAGNGEFCVKHYIGKCNAYQRTYVISPSNVNYWGAVYIEAQRAIDRFKRCSSGSIVKFITMGDVRGLIVYCPANIDLYDPINQCLEQIENQEREIVELSALRDFLLPVLMNGQVKVG